MVPPKNNVGYSLPLPLDEPHVQKRLQNLRQMWEFALLGQFISFFGPKLLKLTPNEEPDINQLEEELLGYSVPTSDNPEFRILNKIEHAIINVILEPRFRTGDFDKDLSKIFKQKYNKGRGCDVNNNQLLDIDPDTDQVVGLNQSYRDLELEDRVRVLAQIIRWISVDDKFRERLPTEDEEGEEDYRINALGYEGEFGTYFLFDDNRLYYQEEINRKPPPLPEEEEEDEDVTIPKPRKRKRRFTYTSKKKNTKKSSSSPMKIEIEADEPRWECICWDEKSWKKFVGGGGVMMKQIRKDILPVIEEDETARKDSAWGRVKLREKAILVANRKKSSRIEQKKKRDEEEQELQRIEEEKRRIEREEKEKDREKVEREKARERRFQRREELKLKKQQQRQESEEPTRRSTRQHTNDDESWEFDCVCGVYGTNYDDGRLSVACEQCDTWMHVECLDPEEKNHIMDDLNNSQTGSAQPSEGYSFVCRRCLNRKSPTQPPEVTGVPVPPVLDKEESSLPIKRNGEAIEGKEQLNGIGLSRDYSIQSSSTSYSREEPDNKDFEQNVDKNETTTTDQPSFEPY